MTCDYLSLCIAGLASVVSDYRWGDFSRMIDVGGAFGSTLAAIMRQHPHMSGVLFDLPQVSFIHISAERHRKGDPKYLISLAQSWPLSCAHMHKCPAPCPTCPR